MIRLFLFFNAGTGILLKREKKHFYDRIIAQTGEAWGHKTRLTPPLVIEVPLPCQQSERSCIFGFGGTEFASFYRFTIRFWKCPDNDIVCF